LICLDRNLPEEPDRQNLPVERRPGCRPTGCQRLAWSRSPVLPHVMILGSSTKVLPLFFGIWKNFFLENYEVGTGKESVNQ